MKLTATALAAVMIAALAPSTFGQTTTGSTELAPLPTPSTVTLPPPIPESAVSTVAPAKAVDASGAVPTTAPSTASSTVAGAANLSRPDFIRGMWVDCIGAGLKSEEGIKKLVAESRDAGFDTLFVQMSANGDAFYNSSLVPKASSIPAGFDPLRVVIENAKSGPRPLKVQVVLVAFRVWNTGSGEPPQGHVAKAHSDWLAEKENGTKNLGTDENEWWLDPGVTEVQDHLAAVAAEVAKNYDVDGIQLDRVRYSQIDRNVGYNPKAVERFNKEKGKSGKPGPADADWCAWRRDQVTETVRKVRDAVKAAKPNCTFSVSAVTFGRPPASVDDYQKTNESYARVFEDWVGWCNQGLVDMSLLMNYKKAETNAADFEQWTDFALKNKGKAKIVIGVGGWLNLPKHTVAMMLHPILDVNADGLVLYSYHTPARAPATAEDFLALAKKVFDPTYMAPKIDALAKLDAPDSNITAVSKLDQFSSQVTGEAAPPPVMQAKPQPAATAPAATAVAAAPAPKPEQTPIAGMPSLTSAGKQDASVAGMPGLTGTAQTAPGTDTSLPSLAQADTKKPTVPADLPDLSSAPGTAPKTESAPSELPALGTAPGATAKTSAPPSDLPGLGAVSATKPSTGEPALPSLGETSGKTAAPDLPTLSEPAKEKADTKPGDLPGLGALQPITEATKSETPEKPTAEPSAVTAPPALLPGETAKTEVPQPPTVLPSQESTAQPALQPAVGSPFDAAASRQLPTGFRPASTPATGPVINIPDYGAQTNYSGQRVTGGTAAQPRITPPSVLTPEAGLSPAEAMLALSSGATPVATATPVSYAETDSPFGTRAAAPGLKYYAPKAARKPVNPSASLGAISSAPMEVIVLKTGREFVARVLERGTIWRLQLPDGSIISMPGNRIATTRSSGGATATAPI